MDASKKWLTTAIAALVAAAIAVIGYRQINSVAIVVKTVTLPKQLDLLSASELTHRLADAIDSIKYDARPSPGQRRYVTDLDVPIPDVEVPLTQTTLPKFISLFRNALGRDARDLSWEVSGHSDTAAKPRWVLSGRLAGRETHQAPFNPNDPAPAIAAIAQGIVSDVEPLILARALLYDNNCAAARGVAQRLLRREALQGSAQAEALNFIGFANECEDRAWGVNISESERYYRDAIAHDSTNGLPHANLARIYAMRASQLRDTAERTALRDTVEREFAIAARLTPHSAGVHESWGWSLLALDDATAAVPHLDSAIVIEPRVATAYFIRADAKHRGRDFAGSAVDYSRGLARAPTDTQHMKAYGQELIFMHDWRGAVGAFSRAARLDTADYDTRYYLGCALRRIDSASAATVLAPVIAHFGPESPYSKFARLVIATDTVSCQ